MRLHRVLAPAVALALAAGCTTNDGDVDAAATTTVPSSVPGEDAAPTQDGEPAASPGCEAEPLAPGRSVVTVSSDGQERTYVRFIPEGLTAGNPAPLVMDFPAYSPASIEESFSGFTKPRADGGIPADEFGSVVVTPEPTNGAGSLLTWNYVDTPGWSDDQQFVTDLLDDVGAAACIDTDRVLATGFAVGAVFASITACNQADRIAVLATVSGLYELEGCDPSTPMPVISFHGTGDRFIPFDGSVGSGPSGLGLSPETTSGLVFMAGRPDALESSSGWADLNGCEAEPEDRPVTDGVTQKTWPSCADGADVELYVIDDGEHTWPGSVGMDAYTDLLGPVSDAVDATDLILQFFEAHT